MRIMDARRQNEHPNGEFVPRDSAIPLFSTTDEAKNYQNRMDHDGQWIR